MSHSFLEVATSLKCIKLNSYFKYRGEGREEKVETRMAERQYSKFVVGLLSTQ